MRTVGVLFAVPVLLLALSGCTEHLSVAEKERLRSGTSDYQRKMLADLHVSEDEYRTQSLRRTDAWRQAGPSLIR